MFALRLQRPTARELLKNKWITKAKKTSYLVDLIDKYKRYKNEHRDEASDDDENEL